MARVYLADEIAAVLAGVQRKLSDAVQVVNNTESVIRKAIAAGQTPTEVEGIGTEGYQAAGILIAEAIAMATTLGADASDGLVFPSIAAIGCPAAFDRVHFDANASHEFYVQAYSTRNVEVSAAAGNSPFGVFAVGEKVRFIKGDDNIDGGVNLTDIPGFEGTIKAGGLADDASTPPRAQMLFTGSFYGGEAVRHVYSDEGGDGSIFEIREIDDGT